MLTPTLVFFVAYTFLLLVDVIRTVGMTTCVPWMLSHKQT